jgi:serine/threonine protein kinase
MTLDRDALLKAVLQLPPEDRIAFLDEACATDTPLRLEIELLLGELDDTEPLLPPGATADRPLGDDGRASPQRPAETLDGALVGAYRIVRELGRGGMAVVYLATRVDGGFTQEVALKLIRRGVDTDDVIARFRQERQILASLNHPNIAQLVDGGIAPDGRPFLAMELVRGEPIDRFCDAHHLSIDERLDLCVAVGGAVQYAHRALVVHRDLKPSNILITPDRQVKLLDFGIAKLLYTEAPELARPTRTSMRVMTPEYASPEQVKGEPITTAADVYQLGLLLFQLLTGRKAYSLTGLGPAEVERVICEQDPPRPSTVARGAATGETTHAGSRSLWRRRSRGVSPELDAIVLTALRKEPDRRYGSVQQLVDDIDRYRRGLPVTARGNSWKYRTGKFLRRHAAAVFAGVMMVAILAGVIAFYSARLAAERDNAQREAKTATSVALFAAGLFEANDPYRSNKGETTAREMLKRGAERIDTELAGQPDVQTRMMRFIADIYRKLGLYPQAVPLLRRALEIQRRTFGPRSTDVAQTLYIYGATLDTMGQYKEARPLLEEALSVLEERLGPNHLDVAKASAAVAALYRHIGSLAESRRLYERALAIEESALGPHHESVAIKVNNLGLVHESLGNRPEARRLFERAVAIHERNRGPDHPLVAAPLMNLADAYRYEKNYAAARPLMERGIAITEKSFGSTHTDLATAINSLANLLNDTGAYEEARPLYERAIQVYQQALGHDHPNVAYPIRNLGNLHRAMGAYREALTLYERSLDVRVRAFGRVHPTVAQSLESVGATKLLLNDARGAEPVLREALEVARKVLPPGHMTIGDASSGLGWCLVEARRFAEAEPLLLEAHRILIDKRGESHAYTKTTRERLTTMYDRWGKPEQAAQYRAAAPAR